MAYQLMIQGTGSTVGKSLIVTALCRILNNEGLRVAPFKSQNMALNSFVTKDGKEMGRAQVVQAEAARVEPSVLMNPVLLKPTSDVGSQVILHGEVLKNMKASAYYGYKEMLMGEVLKAYEILDKTYEVILIEGAGSPAEINLRKNDIVNMGLAEAIDAPVILVGDIDKGGVFAQIYGTYHLLSESEQKRVKGYIINKFRGDVKLLEPGLDMFYERLALPCLGVVPYLDINIEDEDSVTERFHKKAEGAIKIAVIRLPYLSNFTDFSVLEVEPDVTLHYVTREEEFVDADVIVIPGSKNSIQDLRFLKESGLDRAILKGHRQGIPIIGICGGYQMLGQSVWDPFGVEGQSQSMNGLGLLDIETVMAETKKTLQTEGVMLHYPEAWHCDLPVTVTGYEIHMGVTTLGTEAQPFIQLADGQLDGAINESGNVYGTYLHGFFDAKAVRQAFLEPIRMKKGLAMGQVKSYETMKDEAYEHLANEVKSYLDMDKVMEILKHGN